MPLGRPFFGLVRHLSLEDWEEVFNNNILGVINAIELTYPAMVERGSGHIVNLCSITSDTPQPGSIPFAASKAFVLGLDRSLRPEAKRTGIDLTLILPGYLPPAMFSTITSGQGRCSRSTGCPHSGRVHSRTFCRCHHLGCDSQKEVDLFPGVPGQTSLVFIPLVSRRAAPASEATSQAFQSTTKPGITDPPASSMIGLLEIANPKRLRPPLYFFSSSSSSGNKLQYRPVDAVTLAGRSLVSSHRSETLPRENMPEMPIANRTANFGPGIPQMIVDIRLHILRLRRIIERRPAALGIKLGIRPEQLRHHNPRSDTFRHLGL